MPGADKRGTFGVSVLSTASSNRLLPAATAICPCPSHSQARLWPRNRRVSGECRLNATRIRRPRGEPPGTPTDDANAWGERVAAGPEDAMVHEGTMIS